MCCYVLLCVWCGVSVACWGVCQKSSIESNNIQKSRVESGEWGQGPTSVCTRCVDHCIVLCCAVLCTLYTYRWKLLQSESERRSVFDEFCKNIATEQKELAAAAQRQAVEGFK